MNETCHFDHRYPSFTIESSHSKYGLLPESSYQFTREGAVHDYCSGYTFHPRFNPRTHILPSFHHPSMQKHALFSAHVRGPRYSVTMGGCVPRAIQHPLVDYAAEFIPRGGQGCFL